MSAFHGRVFTLWRFSHFHSCQTWGVLILLKFQVNSQKLGEFWVWIANGNVKVWKSAEPKLHKIWHSTQFQQNEFTSGLKLARPSAPVTMVPSYMVTVDSWFSELERWYAKLPNLSKEKKRMFIYIFIFIFKINWLKITFDLFKNSW